MMRWLIGKILCLAGRHGWDLPKGSYGYGFCWRRGCFAVQIRRPPPGIVKAECRGKGWTRVDVDSDESVRFTDVDVSP